MGIRFVDLSTPIANSPPETPEFLRTEIDYTDHAGGAATIEQLLGVTADLLRDGEGWAVEEFRRFGTHNSTHVDAPWHYNSTIQGKPAQTIDELPLEWFFSDGVVLDFTAKAPGDVISVEDVQRELDRIRYTVKERDIVLNHTGAGAYNTEERYRTDHPGMSAAATRWLIEQGVRLMGCDAITYDPPVWAMFEKKLFWEAHRVMWDEEYWHLENLMNLEHIGRPHGFQLCVLPIKWVGTTAAPVRAVAIVDE